MRILLTNLALADRSGTELYIRDLALALLARGHEPIAYSRNLGEVAAELRRATVPVVDDLAKVPRRPDLIHAQHHLEAMTALAHFPETPALYICHGWLPDAEAPPNHPRILRYVAVDELVRQRLVDECGLPEEKIRRHLNFVDLSRFPARRGPLPTRPRKALVFSNQASEGNYLPTLRKACAELGIELDVIGRGVGQEAPAPEQLLASYDIVFAKGRSALEAAAVGAAVVLCDLAGLGPMVTFENLSHLRSFNFGVRLLRDPITVDTVKRELGRYDAADAAEVTGGLRTEIGLDRAAEKWIELYRETLDAYSADEDPRAEFLALARYLRHGPLVGGDFSHLEKARYRLELERAGDWARDLDARLAASNERAEHLEARRSGAEAESQSLATTLAAMKTRVELGRLETERYRSDAESLRLQAEDLRLQAGDLRRQLEEARQQSVDQRAHAEDLRRQAEDLRRRGEEWRNQAEKLEGLVFEKQNQTELWRRRAEKKEEESQEWRSRVDELRPAVEEGRDAATQRRAEQERASAHIAHLTQQIEGHQARLRSLEGELEWIQGSTTWRWRQRILGRPWLRKLYRRVFGLP